MMFISMTLGLLLTSVKGLMTPEQVLNIDCSVASLPLSFDRSISSQVQTVLRPQTPSSTALHISTTSLGAKKGAWMDKRGAFVIPSAYGEKKLRQLYQSGDVMATTADLLTPTTTQSSQVATTSTSTNDPLASSNGPFTSTASQTSQVAASPPLAVDPLASSSGLITPTASQTSQIAAKLPLTTNPPASSNSIPVSTHGNTNTPNVQPQNTVSVPEPAKGSSAILRPSTTTIMSNIQNPNIALTHGTASEPDLTPSTGTITANSKLQASSPSSQALAFGSTTLVTAKPASSKIPPLLTIGGQTVTANSLSQYNIDGQILTPGGIVTVSSTVVSLASDGIDAIIGSKTETLRPDSSGGLRSGSAVTIRPDLMLGTQTLTSNNLGQYNIDGQTLAPGNAITISGTRVSLAPDGSDVVVGTKTEALGAYSTGGLRSGSAVTTRADLIVGTQTLTSNSLSQYNIDGQTLKPGNAITISGTTISLASDGSDVVVGTKTEALGAYITAGLHPSSSGTAVQNFQGKAPGARDGLRRSSMVVSTSFTVLMWLWL